MLKDDPKLTGVRVRELIEPLGFDGGKSIVDDYLREVRPVFRSSGRISGRFIGRARSVSGICGSHRHGCRSVTASSVGLGRGRVHGLFARGRGRPGVHKEAPDVLWGMGRCLWSIGALPELLVWDREGCLHAGGGRPTDVYAAFCGQLPVGWLFCEPADPQAKGCVERLQGYMETNFEPGRRFANELDFQLQLDAWFEKANGRTHKTLRARPIDRLIEEREVMRPLPDHEPDLDRRWVLRVPPDPHLRFDTNDYSLDPHLVGRRVEVRVSQREIIAVALDTGELACRHERCFAKNRTITALEHSRALRERRAQRDEIVVEQRALSVYDQLIA